MTRVLLPTDFSKNSLNAISYALEFFKNSEMHFYMLNVQKTSEYTTVELLTSTPYNSVYKAILEDNVQQLQKLIEKLKKKYPSEKYHFQAIVDFDDLTDSIQQVVNTKKIDLIIMGTNGATGAKEALFGSNTLNVIRQIDCPIIIVPEKFSFTKITTVLFSIHNQINLTNTSIEPLKAILNNTRATLKILGINENNNIAFERETKKNIKEIFNQFEYTLYFVKKIPIPMVISTFEQLSPVDLHAFFVEKETFLERFIYGSATAKINYRTSIPLLILHM